MKKPLRLFGLAALVVALSTSWAMAWGPHPKITEAALEVLPERQRWNESLGEENVQALAAYCWMPDQRGQDLRAFYADDYLLIRAMPRHVGHTMPSVQEAFEPYFRRALQALRTENPVNACRQLGPLVHFVEDVGAPPHAKANCPHHSELENWLDAEQITIRGYQPQLLGKNDEEALQGMLARIAEVVEFSSARAERALPLVSVANPDRAQVEPIILESALESARLTADVLYTVFTLGLAPQAEGAALSGKITAAELPGNNDHGARIVLVDTDYCTLATTLATASTETGWQGEYTFHHLPPGNYRVLAYRVGSQAAISAPVTLETGKSAQMDLALAAAQPAGNAVDNPDGRLSALQKDLPDHWSVAETKTGRRWSSSMVRTRPGVSYRCGAVLKNPQVKVRFELQGVPGKKVEPAASELESGPLAPPEVRLVADQQRPAIVVRVETPVACPSLSEAIERVWIVPEAPTPVASGSR